MRYRLLDSNGDYTFGKGPGNFLVNTPETVAQAIRTRMGLIQGEWFLDTTTGVPYDTKILGMGRMATYDLAIKEVILNTPGVKKIVNYASGVNPNTRAAAVSCTVDTIYGQVTFSSVFAFQKVGNLLDINFVLNQSILM